MKKKSEKQSRSIVKAVTFRIIATITTGIITWFFTNNINIALSLMSVDALVKIFIYYFHERVWNSIKWGKH